MHARALLILGCTLIVAPQVHAFERPGSLFDQGDTNRDGLLTLEEFNAARAAAFPKRDRNGDGVIDAADLPRRSMARSRARDAMEAINAQLDLDHDGKVTRQEFVAGAEPLFRQADRNGDGVVDASEREAAKRRANEQIERLRKNRGT
jgi:Ca2+-binding EF-hand superfamily protein